jgi:hypothetical protein
MGTQLPLPASWARHFVSMPDPRDRLDALAIAKVTARSEIRKVLMGLIEEFGVRPHEIDRAMDHVDDTISDLVWEVENGYRHEIEEGHSF